MKKLFLFFFFLSNTVSHNQPTFFSSKKEFNNAGYVKRVTFIQTNKAEFAMLTSVAIYFGTLGLLLYPLVENKTAPTALLATSCACALRAQKVSGDIDLFEKKLYQRPR